MIPPWKVERHFAGQDLYTGLMSEGVITAIWAARRPYTLGAGEERVTHRGHIEPAFKGRPLGKGR